MQRLLREKTEAVVLALCVASVAIFVTLTNAPDGLPAGIYALGLAAGAGLILNAVAIVLVYRATRVINFAQPFIGLIAASLFLQLTGRRVFIRGLSTVCPPCVPQPDTLGELLALRGIDPQSLLGAQTPPAAMDRVLDLPLKELVARAEDPRVQQMLPDNFDIRGTLAVVGAPDWMVQVNYWLSMVASVAVAMALVWVVYTFIIKRFQSAPRIVLTVATLAAGITTQTVGSRILGFLFDADPKEVLTSGPARVPIAGDGIGVGTAVLNGTDIFAVIVAVVASVALALFLKRSRSGIVLRAVAENPQRARTLGVNVESVTSRAWIIAGALGALSAIIAAADTGIATDGGYPAMVRTLAAAVTGGMVGLPLTIAAALGIGVIDQAVLYGSGSQGAVDGVLLLLVVVVLLAQRARASRADVESQAAWLASRELRPIPRELRGLPPVRQTIVGLAVAGTIWMISYPWFMSPSQVNLASVNMLFAMIGLSLLILTGWAGQISLAQMAFAAVGAYMTAILDWPFPLPILSGAIAGAVAAVLVGLPALRLRGLMLAITTIAFSLATVSLLLEPRYLGSHLPDAVERPRFLGIDFADDRAFYYLVLVLLVGVIAATMGLRRSRTARVLIASKDNEQATQSFAINLLRARLSAFAMSGALAGFAGGLYAYSQHGVRVGSFSAEQSVRVFLMAVVGGLGSIAGPILGALYLGLGSIITELGWGWVAEYLLSPGIGLLVLLVFAPGGLVHVVWTVRDAWLRRIADRYRIHVPSLASEREQAALPIAPKTRPSGGELFIPSRYRLGGQWMVEAQRERVTSGR